MATPPDKERANEGHLYGWLNQLVNLCTGLGLIVLCVSAIAMWWKRRPKGPFGAPVKQVNSGFIIVFALVIGCLAIYLPLFGLTLAFTPITERLILSHLPVARTWLGLNPPFVSTGN